MSHDEGRNVPTLNESRARAAERKTAAGIFTMGKADDEERKEALARIFSGFDVDIDELIEVSEELRKASLGAVMGGSAGPGLVGAFGFMEGLLCGLLYAQELSKSEGGGG